MHRFYPHSPSCGWCYMDGWIHPPYKNLGVERGGPVVAYIDPGLLFNPERSILWCLKLLGGGLGGIDQFWSKPSGSTDTIPPNNCLISVNGPTETCQCQTSHALYFTTPITWTCWLLNPCTVMSFMTNPRCRFFPCTLHFLSHLYYQPHWWPVTAFMTATTWKFRPYPLHCTSRIDHKLWYRSTCKRVGKRLGQKTYLKSMARLGQERDPQLHAPIFTTISRSPYPQYNHSSLPTITGRLHLFHIIQNGWPPSGNTHIGNHKILYYWYVVSYKYH